jgi:hypothetical protein
MAKLFAPKISLPGIIPMELLITSFGAGGVASLDSGTVDYLSPMVNFNTCRLTKSV